MKKQIKKAMSLKLLLIMLTTGFAILSINNSKTTVTSLNSAQIPTSKTDKNKCEECTTFGNIPIPCPKHPGYQGDLSTRDNVLTLVAVSQEEGNLFGDPYEADLVVEYDYE